MEIGDDGMGNFNENAFWEWRLGTREWGISMKNAFWECRLGAREWGISMKMLFGNGD
jgi:hypothetical protein